MLDTIRSFTFHIPTKIEYGLDKFYEIGKLLKGKRPQRTIEHRINCI